MMGTVFQTQASERIDVRPALEYGNIRVVIQHGGEPSLAPVRLMNQLKSELGNFSDDDYILPVGSPAVIAAAAIVAARANSGRVKMLIWDRELKRYYETLLEV